jgi:hypothetical protein
MPKIAASLAVLLTAVTCIGFNTARYPVVWEMLAEGDELTQSDRPDDPAAASQSEGLASSAADAESASGWQPDWQSDDDRADSTDWESTTVEPSPAYATGEDGSSYQYSDEDSYQYSDESSYSYSDEGSYESEEDPYDTNTYSSAGYDQDEWDSPGDYDPYASDEEPPASDGSGNSWYGEDEPVEQVAMRESWDETAPPETDASQMGFDPVAPQRQTTTWVSPYQGNAEDASDPHRSEAWGDEAHASREAGGGLADEPTEAAPPARYASYALGSYGDPPDTQTASPGDAADNDDAPEAGGTAPQTTLAPVKPARAGNSEVIPLPPVDEVATSAVPQAPPAGAEDAIRIYPSTGVE